MIAKWLIVNIITVFIIVLWTLWQGYESQEILLGKVFAQIAFILFLINFNMYFVFLFIRKSKNRQAKIKLVKISKRMMKYHIPFALTATTLVLLHGGIMLSSYLEDLLHLKILSGFILTATLIVLLFSGLLRRRKATGKRRKFHYSMAFLFFGLIIIHIFL